MLICNGKIREAGGIGIFLCGVLARAPGIYETKCGRTLLSALKVYTKSEQIPLSPSTFVTWLLMRDHGGMLAADLHVERRNARASGHEARRRVRPQTSLSAKASRLDVDAGRLNREAFVFSRPIVDPERVAGPEREGEGQRRIDHVPGDLLPK